MLSTFSGPIAWPGGRGARSTALLASRSTSVSRRFRSRSAAGCTARHIGRVLCSSIFRNIFGGEGSEAFSKDEYFFEIKFLKSRILLNLVYQRT